eukprot:gene9363-10350_t
MAEAYIQTEDYSPGEDEELDLMLQNCMKNVLKEIEDGDLENFSLTLDCWPDLLNHEFGDDDIITPLHYAVQKNQLEICKCLIENGSDVNIQSESELKTPLHLAADTTVSPEIMQLLIAAKANLEARDNIGCTALNLLFMEPGKPEVQFQFEKFNMLVDAGASVTTSAAYGSQPLHGSVKIYHSKQREEDHDSADVPLCTQVTKILLDHGAYVNCVEDSLQTPLHFAEGTCPSVTRLLLEYGANVDAKTTAGFTPLQNLARHTTPPGLDEYSNEERFLTNRIQCLELLILHKAEINGCNYIGETALHWLVSRPSVTTGRMLEAFIKRGADVNARTTRMQTPLHYLCIKVKSKSDQVWATASGVIEDLVDVMIKNGADIEAADVNGRTPLVGAVLRGDLKVAKVLLSKGANKSCADRFGKTLGNILHSYDMSKSMKTLFEEKDTTSTDQDIKSESGVLLEDHHNREANSTKARPTLDSSEERLPSDEEESEEKNSRWDEMMDELMNEIGDMGMASKDIEMTKRILFNVLISKAQPDKDLNIDKHINELKNKIGNIDQFCKSKLNTRGIGQVIITPSLSTIQTDVHTLVQRIADGVKQKDARMAFTPILSGSMSEETKIGNVDEFDYLLYMDVVSDMCIVSESVVPGFVHVSAKQTLTHEQKRGIFREGDNAIVANVLGSYLYRLIQSVLGNSQLWQSLHFYWEDGPLSILEANASISNLVIKCAGTGLEISIDLAPVIRLKQWLPKNVRLESPFLRVPIKAFGSLIVVTKQAPEHETFEGGREIYLRLSYSHVEKEIFLSLPANLKESYILAKILISTNVLPSLRPRELAGPMSISSYLLKMAFFTMLEQRIEATGNIKGCFNGIGSITEIRKLTSKMFKYIGGCIKNKTLPSYFLAGQNILQYHSRITLIDRELCMLLAGILE